jgi:fido (protein-threonine AMPylation protein)
VIEAASADDHATPLTPDERGDLIPTHITTRSELNQLEQQNIATADIWVLGRKHYIFRERFLKSLHHRMFNRVWRWAGRFRTTERNLGVKSHLIEAELRTAIWPAPGSADTELGVLMDLEVGHGETKIYAGVQA